MIKNRFLIRSTLDKELKDANGKLKEKYIVRNTSHLRDYSNNLLGDFNVEHSFIEVNSKSKSGYFIKLWDLKSEVLVPIYKRDYRINSSKGCFYLKIDDFMNAKVLYDDQGIVTCKVIHTPTNSNFWHFSLRWYFNDVDIHTWRVKEKAGAQRRILTSAKSYIIQNCHFTEPKYDPCPKNYYS